MTHPKEYMHVWMTLGQAMNLLTQRLDRHLQEQFGLSLIEEFLLFGLDKAGGKLRMVDLSQGLVLSKAGITKMVDRLETSGLVRREASESDRRVTNVVLTEEGREHLPKAKPVMRDWVKENFADLLSKEELTQIKVVFDKLLVAHADPPGEEPKAK